MEIPLEANFCRSMLSELHAPTNAGIQTQPSASRHLFFCVYRRRLGIIRAQDTPVQLKIERAVQATFPKSSSTYNCGELLAQRIGPAPVSGTAARVSHRLVGDDRCLGAPARL